jgi:signal transduction histidine kinase
VSITAEVDENNQVVVKFRDKGIGIPKEILDNLFTFEGKGKRLGTENEAGVGYGLNLVRKFVNLYGGSIEVDSWTEGENKGTEVRLILKKSAI